MLCNDMRREGVKTSPGLEARLFCYVLLHNIRYGVNEIAKGAQYQEAEKELMK